jgi:hypothetical protein
MKARHSFAQSRKISRIHLDPGLRGVVAQVHLPTPRRSGTPTATATEAEHLIGVHSCLPNGEGESRNHPLQKRTAALENPSLSPWKLHLWKMLARGGPCRRRR